MRRRFRLAMAAFTFWLGGMTAAAAQGWQMEPVEPNGARAFIAAGGVQFEVSCQASDTGAALQLAYAPSRYNSISLVSQSIDGEGPQGDGTNTGYLFIGFANTSVQQFFSRDADGQRFSSDSVSAPLIVLLKDSGRMQVMSYIFSGTVYDSISLSGSRNALNAALEACGVPQE